MPSNRDLIRRVADKIENSDSFDMFNMFHADGRPSCIAGHLLNELAPGQHNHHQQPDLSDIRAVSNHLGIDMHKTMRLCQPMGPDADVRARPGAKNYITKRMAAQALRAVADGEEPDFSLPVIEAHITKN